MEKDGPFVLFVAASLCRCGYDGGCCDCMVRMQMTKHDYFHCSVVLDTIRIEVGTCTGQNEHERFLVVGGARCIGRNGYWALWVTGGENR
eukprot:6186818-Pleurochrysis_carterae.AAC.1